MFLSSDFVSFSVPRDRLSNDFLIQFDLIWRECIITLFITNNIKKGKI